MAFILFFESDMLKKISSNLIYRVLLPHEKILSFDVCALLVVKLFFCTCQLTFSSKT
ncbi:protein MON2-like isoform 1 [Corchorus olitorius]|uniref:Protein MON2-like isoform 1 n=1 Tax=Corchorus olitorius TaxID=93759 RepID=A0A1R3JP56_9ROSI|nr:protein MON2-like isoform 1 [Corchorus olitorius]